MCKQAYQLRLSGIEQFCANPKFYPGVTPRYSTNSAPLSMATPRHASGIAVEIVFEFCTSVPILNFIQESRHATPRWKIQFSQSCWDGVGRQSYRRGVERPGFFQFKGRTHFPAHVGAHRRARTPRTAERRIAVVSCSESADAQPASSYPTPTPETPHTSTGRPKQCL